MLSILGTRIFFAKIEKKNATLCLTHQVQCFHVVSQSVAPLSAGLSLERVLPYEFRL